MKTINGQIVENPTKTESGNVIYGFVNGELNEWDANTGENLFSIPGEIDELLQLEIGVE